VSQFSGTLPPSASIARVPLAPERFRTDTPET